MRDILEALLPYADKLTSIDLRIINTKYIEITLRGKGKGFHVVIEDYILSLLI